MTARMDADMERWTRAFVGFGSNLRGILPPEMTLLEAAREELTICAAQGGGLGVVSATTAMGWGEAWTKHFSRIQARDGMASQLHAQALEMTEALGSAPDLARWRAYWEEVTGRDQHWHDRWRTDENVARAAAAMVGAEVGVVAAAQYGEWAKPWRDALVETDHTFAQRGFILTQIAFAPPGPQVELG